MAGPGNGKAASHPHQVVIPDAGAIGVRTYRESDIPHPLQLSFLDEGNERDYVEAVRGLLTAGRADEACRQLRDDLTGFNGGIARLCQALDPAGVLLDGWEDLCPILEEFEGPPVTAIVVGLTNEPDLVFDGGTHDPTVTLGLYSDDAFPFSASDRAAILAECAAEVAGWAGQEEDVEFYVTLAGLADLNTALVHCKHRYFLRDGRDGVSGRAPGGYVEYVLGCWYRAALFLQAATRAVAGHGLPPGARLIAGSAELNTDFATVIEGSTAAAAPSAAPAPVPTLTMKPWVQKPDPTADSSTGAQLRQRFAPAADPVPDEPLPDEPAPVVAPAPVLPRTGVVEDVDAPRPGLLARLFAVFAR